MGPSRACVSSTTSAGRWGAAQQRMCRQSKAVAVSSLWRQAAGQDGSRHPYQAAEMSHIYLRVHRSVLRGARQGEAGFAKPKLSSALPHSTSGPPGGSGDGAVTAGTVCAREAPRVLPIWGAAAVLPPAPTQPGGLRPTPRTAPRQLSQQIPASCHGFLQAPSKASHSALCGGTHSHSPSDSTSSLPNRRVPNQALPPLTDLWGGLCQAVPKSLLVSNPTALLSVKSKRENHAKAACPRAAGASWLGAAHHPHGLCRARGLLGLNRRFAQTLGTQPERDIISVTSEGHLEDSLSQEGTSRSP